MSYSYFRLFLSKFFTFIHPKSNMSYIDFLVIPFIPCHTIVVGYYVFPFECPTFWRPSHLSELGFHSLTWIVFDGFYLKFVYTCIAGVSVLVLLIGKFCQFSTELSACHTSIFLFLYYDLSKYKQIFTKLGMCIDIVETCFGSLFVGKFCQFLTELSVCLTSIFPFLDNYLRKYQWIFAKLGMHIDEIEIWFGIANRKISSMSKRVICLPHNNGGVLSYHVFIKTCPLLNYVKKWNFPISWPWPFFPVISHKRQKWLMIDHWDNTTNESRLPDITLWTSHCVMLEDCNWWSTAFVFPIHYEISLLLVTLVLC